MAIMKLLFSTFLMALLAGCAEQKEMPLSDSQKINITAQRMNTRALELLEGYKPDTIQIRRALKVLDSALIVKPNYSTALHNKYKLQYQLNDIPGMLETNAIIIKNNPVEAEYLIHRAKLYELLNEPDSVKKYYEKGFSAYQSAFDMIGESKVPWQLKLQYAQCLAFVGRNEEANAILKEIELFYQPGISNLKFKTTYDEWMDSWYFNEDGSDYTKYDM
jgi:tetratricopeptide (TPR) repeat protein